MSPRRPDRTIHTRPPRPFQRLLVPTDFSRGARHAAERAGRIPLAASGELHLLHVLAPDALPEVRARAQRALARTAELVRREASRAGDRGKPIVSRTLEGEPFVEIIRHARDIDADLVVMGRKGAGASIKNVLGMTAARVMRMGDAPTLVVASRPRHPYRRPLIALELDASARRLVELVQRVTGSGVAPITAVHAYHVPFTGLVQAGTAAHPSLHHRQCKEDAAEALAQLVKSLETPGVALETVLRRGDPRTVIVIEARRRRADLIGLGTHGRSGIAHALMGSVAEWVIGNTTRDVIVARPVRFTFEPP